MASFDVITAGYHKIHMSKADIGTGIGQSNGRVILTHRPSFPKAISAALIQDQLSCYPHDL
jgi:hypothetical protein